MPQIQKQAVKNEFGLFIETEPTLYLPNLDRYVTFIKGAEKNTIQVNVKELLHDVKDRVLSAEIHYNPHTTEIASDIEGVKYFDIFTGKEIESSRLKGVEQMKVLRFTLSGKQAFFKKRK